MTLHYKTSRMKDEAVVVKPIRSLEDALTRCQTLGMRLSRQRRFILELLWQVQEHLSAREIYDRLNQQGKAIGHTSVYQNLEALSSQGIIECIERSDGRLYGNISDSHSHVNCLDTNQILDIHVELPADLLQAIEEQLGVKITDYRIDFYGYQLNGSQTQPALENPTSSSTQSPAISTSSLTSLTAG
jgi:Fur family ferric uptake transcriptional regulator